jgi:CRISPR/Cas system-associated endonuclease Cas1
MTVKLYRAMKRAKDDLARRVYATGSRNASHPVNAIMNYAYAVLQSQVQIKAVADGYDPMLGIMHSDRDDAAAFVFDMMEPERPKVDRVVRLNPELARRVAKVASCAPDL